MVGSCQTGGIDDKKLVPGPDVPGPLTWSAQSLRLKGLPSVSQGLIVLSGTDLTVLGKPVSAADLVVKLDSPSISAARTGFGARIIRHRKLARGRKSGERFVLQGARATVTRDKRNASALATLDLRYVLYEVQTGGSTTEATPSAKTAGASASTATMAALLSDDEEEEEEEYPIDIGCPPQAFTEDEDSGPFTPPICSVSCTTQPVDDTYRYIISCHEERGGKGCLVRYRQQEVTTGSLFLCRRSTPCGDPEGAIGAPELSGFHTFTTVTFSEIGSQCFGGVSLTVQGGGLPDGSPAPPIGPANVAAGAVDDDVHRRQFRIDDPDGVGYTITLTGPQASSGPQARVTVGTTPLALGGSLTLSGSRSGVFHSGALSADYTLTLSSGSGGAAASHQFRTIATDISATPTMPTDCPPNGTLRTISVPVTVVAHDQAVAGHTIQITNAGSTPTTATVDISPASFVTSNTTTQIVTISYRQSAEAQAFSLIFSDQTLAPESRNDRAADLRVQPCGQAAPTVNTCVLQPPKSDASQADVGDTGSSLTGEQQGAGMRAPRDARTSTNRGCKTESCSTCFKGLCDDAVGDPVLIATGQLAEFHTDFGWRTPGGTLNFERTYLSGRRGTGLLGTGWSHNFAHRIEDRGAAGAVLHDPVGNQVPFSPDGTGGYRALASGGLTLTRDASGWQLRYRVGATYRFRADGRLGAVVDNNGNTFTLVYSAAGDLSRIEDGAGGAILVEVADGLIRSLTAKNGDRIQFAYSPDRRLTIATDTVGQATVYGYDTSTGLLNHIQRPVAGQQGLVHDIRYNSSGQAIEVSLTDGTGQVSTSRFAYPDATTRQFTTPSGQTYTFRLDARRQIVERVDPNGDIYRVTRDAEGRPLTRTEPGTGTESWTYDVAGRLATHTTSGGETTRVERDQAGFPIAIIRPDGAREERGFDAAGNLVSSKDASGRVTTYTRNARGQVISVQVPGGGITSTAYDAAGNVSQVTDAAGQTTTYERDALGREIAVTTPGGRTSRTEYCQCGSVSARIDPEGNRTTYSYDALGALLSTTAPNGARTEYTYLRRNGMDLVSTVTDALGNVTRTEYDANGRVVASIDAQGRRTTFEFDTLGRVTRVNSPGGAFTLTRYNAAGLVAETENARGAITSYVYDTNRRLIQTALPDGSTTAQAYDANGRVIRRTAADGGVVQTVYDADGRVIATVDPMGHVSRTEYGPSGTVTRSVDTRDHATHFEYDALDRVVRTINALGFASRQEYSSEGEVELVENARGAVTRYSFDQLGRVLETTDPLGNVVKRRYDSVGNVVRVEDERGKAWTFGFDALNRKIRETDPSGRSTTYTYTAHELTRTRHTDGSEWRYAYDAAGRLNTRQILKPSGAIEDTESFGYDILGNRTRAENAAVKIISEYDLMNREVKRTTTWKRTGAVRELAFTYDAQGRRQVMRDSHGRLFTYTYDKDSRPTTCTVLEPNQASRTVADAYLPRTYRFSWDATNNLTLVEYPNGVRTRRDYDNINRLTRLVHERVTPSGGTTTLASWQISRDAVGNPTRIVREDGDTWTMDHDLKDQLTRAVLPRELVRRLRNKSPARGDDDCRHNEDDDEDRLLRAGEISYRYDKAGNRIEENYAGQVVSSTFGPTNEMLTRGSTAFTYDARGNQLEKRFKSGHKQVFGYSAAGKLESLSTGHSHQKERDRSHEKQIREVERYLYAPGGERVLVEDMSSKTLTHALWDGHRPIDEWHEIGHGNGKKEKGLLYARGLGGELLDEARYTRKLFKSRHTLEGEEDCDDWDDRDEWKYGGPEFKLGHVRFIQSDFLGSTSLVTNHKGKVLDRLQAGPWGEPLEGNYSRVRFGYTGHQFEARAGHWGAMHRNLDPRVGRWTQRDPLGDIDGANRYSYARRRPLSATDPLGLVTWGGNEYVILDAQLYPNSDLTWRSGLALGGGVGGASAKFVLSWNKPPHYPGAGHKNDQIRVIQIVRSNFNYNVLAPWDDTSTNPNTRESFSVSDIQLNRNVGWFVDVGSKTESNPYLPPQPGTDSFVDDSGVNNVVTWRPVKFDAEAVVVRLCGDKSTASVIGAVKYGWSWDPSTGAISTPAPRPQTAFSENFLPSVRHFMQVRGSAGVPEPTW